MTFDAHATGPVHSEIDDPDFRGLLVEFVTEIPARRQGLLDAHREQDSAALRTRAHQLKGSGGGYGFPQLSTLAAELERACDAHDPARIVESLDALVDLLNRIAV
ncbi:MAG: Hpt domain-containing protein [Planctomycetia bacterium]|nr:Hpt domain-containing protein [Planctomycetia bacterium]